LPLPFLASLRLGVLCEKLIRRLTRELQNEPNGHGGAMLRDALVMGGMLGVQALVVLHWFRWPESAALAALAMGAAALMTVMALGSVARMVDVLRSDARDPRRRDDLAELGRIEPRWVAMTLAQFVFIAAAALAGVVWLALVLAVGHGAELVAMAAARLRTRSAAGAPDVAGAAR
jgi:hypothetical protein